MRSHGNFQWCPLTHHPRELDFSSYTCWNIAPWTLTKIYLDYSFQVICCNVFVSEILSRESTSLEVDSPSRLSWETKSHNQAMLYSSLKGSSTSLEDSWYAHGSFSFTTSLPFCFLEHQFADFARLKTNSINFQAHNYTLQIYYT